MRDARLFLSFAGRITRLTFWKYIFVCWALYVGIVLLAWRLSESAVRDVALAVQMTLAWPLLATFAKRWHDRDAPGWFALLVFVPLANLWALVECGFRAGTLQRNKYGDPPLGLVLPTDDDED